jgi:hypothetical protein
MERNDELGKSTKVLIEAWKGLAKKYKKTNSKGDKNYNKHH